MEQSVPSKRSLFRSSSYLKSMPKSRRTGHPTNKPSQDKSASGATNETLLSTRRPSESCRTRQSTFYLREEVNFSASFFDVNATCMFTGSITSNRPLSIRTDRSAKIDDEILSKIPSLQR